MTAVRSGCGRAARVSLRCINVSEGSWDDRGGDGVHPRSSSLFIPTRIMVRITTWNVNGIRNPFGYKPWSAHRTFGAMFDILEADIVIMQELKIQRKDLTDDMVLVPGWDCYFSLPKHKKGIYIYWPDQSCITC